MGANVPDDNPTADLLDVIDKLTKPNVTKILQETIAGQPPNVRGIRLPPLLTQLENAIRGGNVAGASAALANERNILDSDALHRFLTIKSTIGDWARSVKSDVRPGDPAGTLRAWYVAYTASPRELDSVRFYLGKTRSWVYQIEAKLDPPRIRELPDRCPECKATDWWNPVDKHRYLHPLVVEYKPTGADMIQEARGKCRACEKSWGVRQLAFDIEQDSLSNGLQITPM